MGQDRNDFPYFFIDHPEMPRWSFVLGIEQKEKTSYSTCLCELKSIKQGDLGWTKRKTFNRKLWGRQLNEAVGFLYRRGTVEWIGKNIFWALIMSVACDRYFIHLVILITALWGPGVSLPHIWDNWGPKAMTGSKHYAFPTQLGILDVLEIIWWHGSGPDDLCNSLPCLNLNVLSSERNSLGMR